MSQAPTTPELFFAEYVPARVARLSAALGAKTSPGSVLFDVVGAGKWGLRLRSGALEVASAELPERLLTIAVKLDDFAPVIATGAERVGDDLPLERQMMAARILTLDSERAAIVRSVKGNLGLALSDGALIRRLLIAPAAAKLDIDQPDCEIACSIEDFWAMQAGSVNPFELLMNGRIRLGGDAAIAMALSGVFG